MTQDKIMDRKLLPTKRAAVIRATVDDYRGCYKNQILVRDLPQTGISNDNVVWMLTDGSMWWYRDENIAAFEILFPGVD